jgi:O-acetylserine/cysteine efflux transporter
VVPTLGAFLPTRHLLIALLVVAVWGINFVFIKIALLEIPPFTLAALRFLFVAFPAVFIVPRPKVPWISLIAYGLTNFAFQFGFLFLAMKLGMSAGLASMVLQVQVFFTMGLAVIFFNERPNMIKIAGALIAFSGVALVGLHSDKDVNLLGLLLLLCGAFSWASGNIISKSLGAVNPLAVVIWGGLVALPALSTLAWVVEGSEISFSHLLNISFSTIGSLAYIVYLSTLFAYSLWSWLIREYKASTVAPFTLLVPVFGFLASALLLNETLADWKILAGALVVSGLCVNVFAARKKI